MTTDQLRDCQRAATRIGCDLDAYLSHREAGERHCARCGWQPSSAFGASNWCRVCQNNYIKSRRHGAPRQRNYRRREAESATVAVQPEQSEIEVQKAALHAWIRSARRPIGRW